MLEIKVNGNRTYEVELLDGETSINGQSLSPDIVKNDLGEWHILVDGKGYRARVLEHDLEKKTMKIMVNGNEYQIGIRDRYDQLLHDLGMDDITSKKISDIKAPMPGLVLDVMVSPGDEVDEGSTVLVLEAMKMENVIKSPGAGIVDQVKVEKGEAIEKGSLMISFKK